MKKTVPVILTLCLAAFFTGCSSGEGNDKGGNAAVTQSHDGQGLSSDYIFDNEWVNEETGETMTFDPERFIEFNGSWSDAPEGLYYSYSDGNIIKMFLDGGHLKDHYFEFNPNTQVLEEYMFDDVLSRWHIAGGQ